MIVSNLIMKRGKTLPFSATCTSNGVPFDLTGASLKFLAKRNVADADGSAVITKTTAGGGIVVPTPTNGVAQVQILAADTQSLANEETVLVWELQVTSSSNPFTVAAGLLTIEPAVVQASS
jgi:hypothetical protein